MLVTSSLWRHMWGAVLAVEREGGGLLCATKKPSTPRYSSMGKPAHPTDRPTGTITQLAFCSFLDQLPPRLPPRPPTNPTFTSFLTKTPIVLTKELLHLPDAPSLLAQQCKLWRELPEHHHLRFVTVYGLRVVSIPTIPYLHCQNKPKHF